VAVINRSASKVPLPMMPAAASKSSQRYVVVPWRRIWYSWMTGRSTVTGTRAPP